MYTDTISIDGYGIRLDQLNLDNDTQSPLIKIALNRILNDDINDDFIGIIDDISGNHYEENDRIDINAGVLTWWPLLYLYSIRYALQKVTWNIQAPLKANAANGTARCFTSCLKDRRRWWRLYV